MKKSNLSIEKTTALITGASSGIGLELAKVFAGHGHDLVLVARDRERLERLADELRKANGITVKVVAKDLSNPTSAQELVTEIERDGRMVTSLVNNAGFDVYGNFAETDLAKELDMIQVNLVSLTRLTKLLLPAMIQQGHGRILNLGSTGSYIPSPLNAVYSATKAYVLSFSIALAEELRGTGVTVTALCPGAVSTEFQARAGMDNIRLLRFGALSAPKVAETGYRAMFSGRRVVVPGLFNKVQVVSSKLLPGSWIARMAITFLK